MSSCCRVGLLHSNLELVVVAAGCSVDYVGDYHDSCQGPTVLGLGATGERGMCEVFGGWGLGT